MSRDPNLIPPGGNGYIDPLQMARFLVLPGADQLLQAFSRIPPGPLRDSVIQHAEVIAQTYAGAPAAQQMPDPLLTAAQATAPPKPALPQPERRPPKTQEEQIVKLRLAGQDKAAIIKATGVSRQKLDGVLIAARRAGVKFPKLAAEGPTGKGFAVTLDQLDGRGIAVMEKAAMKRGHSLETYLQARTAFLQMRAALQPMDEIAKAVRVDEATLWAWLYVARRAGHDLPTRLSFEDAAIEPAALEPPPAAQKAPPAPAKPKKAQTLPEIVPAPGRPVFQPIDQMADSTRTLTERAAALRGLTLQAYYDLRESIVLHRYSGKGAVEIFSLVGTDMDFIKNACANAKEKGVRFPPISSPFNATVYSRRMDAKGTPIQRNAAIGDKWAGGRPKPSLAAE